MAKHALLSASSSKRWLSCPPSARLEERFPDSQSEYAAEGSFAHEMAELILRRTLNLIKNKEYQTKMSAMIQSPHYSPELYEHIEDYVDFVIERYNAACANTPDAEIMLEQRLDFSEWVPEGFGTGDVAIVADGYVEIIDLKYGKGVAVEADGNTQMQLYGLGAYNELGQLYRVDNVKMTVFQPRLNNIASQEMALPDLLDWGERTVKPIAEMAFKGDGEFCPGDHCRFCRAKATCRARAEAHMEIAKYDFIEPDTLRDDEISEILAKAAVIKAWCDDVQAYALEQAERHGKKYAGWKLVEGRSNRVYADDAAVAAALTSNGFEADKIFTRKLLGITDMEKLLGKKRFSELLGDYVVKPIGKPTLVPETDKRPELSSIAAAAADFKEAI